MKIFVVDAGSYNTLQYDALILGFALQVDGGNPERADNYFRLEVSGTFPSFNSQDEKINDVIWKNIPIGLGMRDYVFWGSGNVSPIIFPLVKPFFAWKGSQFKLSSNDNSFDGKLFLYTLFYKTKPDFRDLDVLNKNKKFLGVTKLEGISIDTNKDSITYSFSKKSKLISVGCAIPKYNATSGYDEWVKQTGAGSNFPSAFLEDDFKVKLRISSMRFSMWDDEFRPARVLMGDMQFGKRLSLSNFFVSSGTLFEILLSETIDSLNSSRTNKYGKPHFIFEYTEYE